MPKLSQKRLLARRRGIIRAAARCLERNGLQATGMRDFFRAANLSPGALYSHFSSKEDLLAAVAAASPSVVEAALAATDPAAEGADRFDLLLEAAAAGLPGAGLQLELEAAALHSASIASALQRRRAAARLALATALSAPAVAGDSELIELAAALCEGLARRRLLEPEADLSGQLAAARCLLPSRSGSAVPS